MSTEPDSPAPTPTGPVVHQFTVLRGMAVALVIETRDWYSGLLQAAVARTMPPAASPCGVVRGAPAARPGARRGHVSGLGASRGR
jgi:hypothetical protein